MIEAFWQDLHRDLTREALSGAIQRSGGSWRLHLDGVAILMQPQQSHSDDLFLCWFVDVGEIDSLVSETALRNILNLNLRLQGDNGESLGLDDGHLYLRARMWYCPELQSADVVAWLRIYVDVARRIQRDVLQHTDCRYPFAPLMAV